jgi:hypothetical protein
MADGYPVPNITWTTPSGHVSQGKEYNISSINRNDAGTYICTARNIIGSAEGAVVVTVQCKYLLYESAVKIIVFVSYICETVSCHLLHVLSIIYCL